ncbi:UNVERIFIED_CONTAM: hypothetical protein NCL1_42051 [Trichonephila clavipes]
MDEDEENNQSSKGPSNAHAFSALKTAMEWYEQQSECCPIQQLLLKRIGDLAGKKRKFRMVQRKISVAMFIVEMNGGNVFVEIKVLAQVFVCVEKIILAILDY